MKINVEVTILLNFIYFASSMSYKNITFMSECYTSFMEKVVKERHAVRENKVTNKFLYFRCGQCWRVWTEITREMRTGVTQKELTSLIKLIIYCP